METGMRERGGHPPPHFNWSINARACDHQGRGEEGGLGEKNREEGEGGGERKRRKSRWSRTTWPGETLQVAKGFIAGE